MHQWHSSTRPSQWIQRGVVYPLGIGLTIACSSALTLAGMRTGRGELAAIALAGAIPAAGLVLAIIASLLQPPPAHRPLPPPDRGSPDLVGGDHMIP